jgi:hypothetical protein
MAACTAPFAAGPLDLTFGEDDPADAKTLRLHWQQGRFREERTWLGETEVYAYDGQDYWFGSNEALPFALDHGASPDVTHEFVLELYYAVPAQSPMLRILSAHELSEARKLPQLRGFLLLDYAPAGMSEAWLLLDPQTLLLRGSLLGDQRSLDDSGVLQVSLYGPWTDFGGARYPSQIEVLNLLDDGTQLSRHVLRTQGIAAGPVLPPAQFQRGSAPAVAQPELPGGQLSVPFRVVDDGITLDATVAPPAAPAAGSPAGAPAPLPLVLKFDSGANVGLLRRDSAWRLGLRPAGHEAVNGHGGTARLQFAVLSGVHLGAAEVPPFEVAVTADDGGPKPGQPGYDYYQARIKDRSASLDGSLDEDGVDGLLGTSLLNNYVVRIDYAHRQLTLFGAAQFSPALLGAPAEELPLTRSALPFTAVTVDGTLHGGAFFNTGARPFFSLEQWALDRAHATYPLLGVARGLSIHGPQAFGIVRPGVVELGSLKLERPTTLLERQTPGEPPDDTRIASFGSEFFHDHVVTFDVPHEKVYVQ